MVFTPLSVLALQ